MQHQKWFATAIGIIVAGLMLSGAVARAFDFDFKIEELRIDGSSFGTHDGSDDYVNTFDVDGLLDPPFVNNLGTTTVGGGYLHLESPGALVPVLGIQLVRSEVKWSTNNHLLKADGFRIRSVWDIDPDTELYEGISFASMITNGPDVIIIVVLNWSAADAAVIGIDPGLQILLVTSNTGPPGYTFTSVPLSENQFTGLTVMEFEHVAGSTEISARISFNGGTTYTDFGTKPHFLGSASATYWLYADPIEGSAPPTPTPVPTPCPTPTPAALDSYTCYKARDLKNPPYIKNTVGLIDQFQVHSAELKKLFLVCAPTVVNLQPLSNPSDHLCCHKMKGQQLASPQAVEVVGLVVGTSQAEVQKPYIFCEPCSKSLLP